MNRYSLFSFALCASALLSACSQGGDNDGDIKPDPKPAAKLEMKISPSIETSRATDDAFENGDCVGLYVVRYDGSKPGLLAASGNYVDNMRFRYTGVWTPDSPIYWPDNTTHADFYLYYPYADVRSVTAYPFAVKADQSTESAYKQSDFLIGKASDVAPSENAVGIIASHVMSRMIIYIEPGDGFTAQSLAAAAVSLRINGLQCGSTVDFASGSATPVGDAVSITPFFAGDCYKALVVPQTVAEGNLITVTVDGRDYNLKKAFTFKKAVSHKFTVKVSRSSSGVNVSISAWGDDGTDNGGVAE